ncbi:hypothetical protein HYT56_04140 [Candidatus Woesearchaeota archaeon]|nr:hypothetical protein [Candidatus Woesearchaeota archaeon]
MTTVLGIKTNSGIDSVILVSDTQHTIDYGDFERKTIGGKIRVGENHAIAFTGNSEKFVERFSSYISGRTSAKNFVKEIFKGKVHPLFSDLPKDPIKLAIEAGFFPELSFTNSAYYRSQENESNGKEVFDYFTELILAVNKPDLGLYYVDGFGNLSSSSYGIEYLVAGSGREIVQTYIDEEEFRNDPAIKEEFSEDRITTPLAMKLAIGGLRKATKDGSTGGPIDLVVVTADSINVHGSEIRRSLDVAEREIYQKIVTKYLTD